MTAPDPSDAAAIAAEIGFSLPPEAKPLHAQRIDGRDNAARLLAVMPETAWTALSATPAMRVDPRLFTPEQAAHLGPDEGAWTPSREAGLTAAQTPWRDGREVLNIGVARAAGQVRLYLFWHQL